MIRPMTTARPQQRYDHRLRELVHRAGDPTIATDLGVPQSTARGWLRTAPTVVIGLDVADLTEHELRHEVLKLRRRVEKLAALLRLALSFSPSPSSPWQASAYPMVTTSSGSCGPSIRRVPASRCEPSSSFSACRRVGFTRGDGGTSLVPLTISRPVRAGRRID